MRAVDESDLLLEDDGEAPWLEDFLNDSPAGCLFCRLGELDEGDYD